MNVNSVEIKSIHGTSPEMLIEKIVRLKIHDSVYWKEKCFGLTAKDLVDRAVSLKYVGGTYGGNQKPTKFLCLLLKMLYIQPDDDIVMEFIQNRHLKYLSLLGAFYMRLTGRAIDIYTSLEPFLNDYRPICIREPQGTFKMSSMDQVVDCLLNESFYFSISFPRLLSRYVLEDQKRLEKRKSKLYELDDDFKPAGKQVEKQPLFKQDVGKDKESPMMDDVDEVNALRKQIGLKPLKR